jgi:hypothetical protein
MVGLRQKNCDQYSPFAMHAIGSGMPFTLSKGIPERMASLENDKYA